MFYSITIDDQTIPITIRKHPRSRRMVIRYNARGRSLNLTLPRYVSIRKGLNFVEERRRWIEERMQEDGTHVPFKDGEIIPFRGEEYLIRHIGGRGVVHIPVILNEVKDLYKDPSTALRSAQDDNNGERVIIIPGDIEFLPRRLTEWLKKQAREIIVPLAQQKAAAIGVSVKKISLRDTTSRWGSCSHDGNLSFSWRLIFAPHEVLDYLVCHEVAHLREHNHSAAFWKLVAELCPTHETHREWLKANGPKLYRYG